MIVGIPDKLLVKWLGKKKYITPADEGEAIAIAAGHFWATGRRATVFMSADGFANALSPLTSWVIPEGIEMNLVISCGRSEYWHIIMSRILKPLISITSYDPKKITFDFIEKE